MEGTLWQRPRTRRRHLLRLGIDPRGVVTRSRKGSWRISSNSLMQAALSNRWLAEQGPALAAATLDRPSLSRDGSAIIDRNRRMRLVVP
jgi:hypothetical protein